MYVSRDKPSRLLNENDADADPFSPVAPPQLSDEEIKQMETEASFTLQQVLVSAVLLYLCK